MPILNMSGIVFAINNPEASRSVRMAILHPFLLDSSDKIEAYSVRNPRVK